MSTGPAEFHRDALPRVLAVARRLGASSDLPEILHVIIDAMRDLLDAERATVFEYDAEREELFGTVAHGFSAGSGAGAPEIRLPLRSGLAGESARTRRLINVPDARADPRFHARIDAETGFVTRSLLTIPLVGHDDELVGVAQVLNKRDGPFLAADEEIAAALAAQAAVAMKRGRLIEDRVAREKLERDLELARRIQQSGFPQELPELEGFEIAAWSEPAEETGGDSYDVIGVAGPGATGRVAFLLADATGHGIGPALSVTQVQSMVRMAVRLGGDLAATAHHLNEQLCRDLPDDRFVTAWLGELDGSSGRLASFSAGQGPLLRYVAAERRVITLDPDTMPLGIVTPLEFALPPEVVLEPGDLFAVVSDGIFEARSPDGDMFGQDRVERVIAAAHAEPAPAILAALRTAVDAHTCRGPAEDDRTVILIRRMGEGTE